MGENFVRIESIILHQSKADSMAEVQQMGLELSIDEQTGQGRYSNLVVITHSASEFVLDFAAILPGLPKAKVKSRIILTPEHAKRLLLSLQENVSRYETNVGRIELQQPPMATAFPQKLN